MKANELMIGDWVCFDGDYQYECPVKVNGLSIDDVSVGEEGFLGGEDQVVPIPLTEEILKLNFIEHSLSENDKYYSGMYRSRILIEPTNDYKSHPNCWLVRLSKEEDKYTVKNEYYINYVHELQHILRISEITEPADNFRVL